MVLSFRAKTILGIALIEAVLLGILIFNVMHFLRESNDSQFSNHIQTARNVFTSLIRDEVLASDLAQLHEAVGLLANNRGVSFVRILDSQNRVLAQSGIPEALTRPFNVSRDFNDAPDGIYRTVANIEESGVNFAQVQLGFDVAFLQNTYTKAERWSFAIALAEMGLVALFSLALGTYLMRQIRQFTNGANKISAGVLGLQLPVVGHDEIAQATRAFNAMSLAISNARESLEGQVRQRTSELEERNHRLRHLLDERSTLLNSQTVGLVTLQDRTILWCNDTFLRMMGYESLNEIQGETTRKFYAREEDFIAVGEAYREHGDLSVLNRDFEFVSKDGRSVWVDLSGSRLPAERQSLWVIVDVSQRVKSQQALQRSESKFRTLFESTSEAIMVLDGDRFIDCNPSTLKMFGAQSKDQICSISPANISPEQQPCGTDSIALSHKWIERAYTEGSVRFEWVHQRLDTRQKFAAEVLLSLVPFEDHKALLAVVWDVSERQALIEKIRRQANYDHLTGMFNRRYFMELAERELERARRSEKPLAVLGIDIDHFKRINDTYGHKAGDLALKKFAEICHEVVRQTDLAGRMGGEEFAILLPETDLGSAREIAERLRKRVDESELVLPDGENVVRFTVSVGLALLLSKEHAEIDMLLQKADAGLYQAKKSGRNKVVVA